MKKILFICAENAGRSQMAEAFFNHYAKENGVDWIAESNGTTPADKINPVVIEAMSERGIPLADTKPKLFQLQDIGQYEKVISFGCLVKATLDKEVQNKLTEWHIDDPRGEGLEKVRVIRDEIEGVVVGLGETL